MAHGNGAAPGVHRMGGAFYELAAPFFESACLAADAEHPHHRPSSGRASAVHLSQHHTRHTRPQPYTPHCVGAVRSFV